MVIIFQMGEEFWIELVDTNITFAALDTETDSALFRLERAGDVMAVAIGHQGGGSIGKEILFTAVDAGGGGLGINEYAESVILRGFQRSGATALTAVRVILFMRKSGS